MGMASCRAMSASLKRKGLNPPSVWAGKRTAREWVRELGFPVEFAGFSGMRREAEMEVEGPPVLGDLHEYQRTIADRVRHLLDPANEMRRGLLSLPTGAGKTRVAVQALVEHMSEAETDVRIIWLAETDELCEQATQTWSQVWRAKGRAGHADDPEPAMGEQRTRTSGTATRSSWRRWPSSTPSSNATTASGRRATAGSSGPSIIVVDEAHRSIGPQYTRTLSAMGGTKRVAEMTTPLLGLTATPFRGFNATRDGAARWPLPPEPPR